MLRFLEKLGQQAQSPSSSRLLSALPRELQKPQCRGRDVTAGTTPGPRARRGRAKADAGAGSAVPARIAQSITALRRRVLGLPAWALSTLGRSTHRGKGEDYGK